MCENYFLLLKYIVCAQLKTVIFACFLLSIDQSLLLTVKMCICVHIYLRNNQLLNLAPDFSEKLVFFCPWGTRGCGLDSWSFY